MRWYLDNVSENRRRSYGARLGQGYLSTRKGVIWYLAPLCGVDSMYLDFSFYRLGHNNMEDTDAQ